MAMPPRRKRLSPRRPRLRPSLASLPETAINEILIRLPIKDAVRTSVLSRPWRRRWHSIPDLNLSGLSAIAISQVLLHHSSPVLVFRAQLRKHDPIYCWLSTLSHRTGPRPSLRTLTLTPDSYTLPADISLCIISIASYFPNLTHLHLECNLSFSRDCFSGIPKLRTLHLIGYCGQLSVLVSSFPLLEELVVANMNIENQCLHIAAPNLRRLELAHIRCHDFSISNVPLLESASIDNCFGNGHGGAAGALNLRKFLCCLGASVNKLGLNTQILRAWARDLKHVRGKIPMRIPSSFKPFSFDHLRVLSLNVLFTSKKQISFALCLLRSTPNLDELEIRGCVYSVEGPRRGKEFWEAQEHVDLFDRLERVKMTEIGGINSELDFIRFVLGKARMLKTMMITFIPYVRNKESVKTKLVGFPRVSNQAQVLLTEEAEAEDFEEWE